MADLGLTKAIGKAVRAGVKGAKVLRPAEQELIDREALAAAKAAPAVDAPIAPAIMDEVPAPTAPGEPAVLDSPPSLDDPSVPAAAPTAPVTASEPVVPLTPAEETLNNVNAFRLSRSNIGDFHLDESYQPNFDRMTTTDDIKGAIADASQKNIGKVTEARRDKITNEQLKGLADDLDLSEGVVRKIMERETGGALNAETILGARQMLVSSAARLKSLADKIAVGQATDIEKVQFARQIQFHNEYQAQFMGARAEAGRALNAFNIPVGSDATQIARMSEIISNVGRGGIEKLAKAVSLADSVSGVTQVVKPGIFKRSYRAGQGFLNHVFVNAILSGPTSHMANIGGNALFQAMNIGEMAVAARLGKFLPGDEHVQVGEALASLHGTLSATKDAWRLAYKALKSGKTLDDAVKYDAKAGSGITGTNQLKELDKPYLGKLIRGIEAGIGIPSRFLGAEDDAFKTLAYRANLERQALLHTQDQIASGAASADNAGQVARDFVENAPEDAQKQAEDWAGEMTFQTPLGPIGQTAQRLLRSVPVATLIAPFVRTPVNIFKQGVARSPMALFSAKFWKDMQAGGRSRDLALTKFAMGSATSALIAKMVSEGDVTGAGPQEPVAKMLWEANGRRPYSIRVRNPTTGEDTWHSYARMEPIATTIGATADTVELLSYLESDSPDAKLTDEQTQAYNAAGAVIAGIMNNTGNKTFMKGISDFIELTNDPGRQIASWSNQMGSSLVPFSAGTRAARNIEDPYLREAWTLTDKIKDNLPGYSKDLPPRLGLFGEMREKNSSSMLGTMSPMPESSQNYDPVYQELQEVMQSTRLVPVSMPEKRIEGMKLTAQEYADYVRIARSEPIFGGGKTFKDVVEKLMQSSVYQRATPTVRVELLKNTQSQADRLARAQGGALERDNPDYADRISQWRLAQNRLRTGS